MKKLQNNFTTQEESRRLLKIGVPRWTADEYIDQEGYRYTFDGILDIESFFRSFPDFLPCWSVGRLIEISELCYTSLSDNDYFIRQKDCNIDFLIKMFELGADLMDFSKLED